jgi:hypothetical protein
MKLLWILIGLAGIWFVASSATENGLLPSGHAIGRVPEAIIGVILVAYAFFRLYGSRRPKSNSSS